MNVSLHTRAARLLPIGIFVLLALLVLGVWGFLRAQERVLTTGAVAVAADQTARYVRDYLAVRQMAVSQLAVFWDSGRPLRGADFVDAATRIEAQFPGIQSINLVDRQGVIIQVAPLSGNRKAIGLNINSYPAGRTALAAARATGRWVATPPIDLVQGGRGFVALLAIGGGADHAAFLQIVIRLDQLAHQIWQMSDSGRIGLAIDDQSVPVLRLDPGAADGVPVERDVAVADRTWTIRLVPAPPPMLRVAHAVPVIVGLLVAALVAWLVEQAIRRNVALRASEKRFRDYAEAASDWFWESDPAGQLTYLSASFESVLGKSVTPFVGQPIECLMHALDVRMLDGRPMQSEDLPRTRGGTSIQRIHAADGESIMLLIRWHAVRGPDGRVVGCRGAGTDLRRETAAYERAILAEHRLHHAIQSISQGFALFDDQERLVLCNDRYLSFLPETVHSRLVTGISHEEIAELLAEAGLFDGVDRRLDEWQALFRSGDRSIEFQARGGPWLQISYGGTDEGGRVIVVTDISDLKQREAVIRNSEERYRSLVDGSIQGMLVHRAGRLLFANHTAAEMLGFQTAAQAVECGDLLPFRSRRVPERIGLGPDPLLAELATGEVRDFEIEATRRDGMPLWLVVRASRVDWNGEPAMQMTLFDGTSHKQIERSLLAAKEMAERASRAKSTFLAQMSHELRTPLNAVIGFSEILQQEILGPLGNARYREYADDIAASGRHLLAVINDILDVAKFEAGRLSLQESRISLGEIIQSSLRMLHERAEAADILLDSAVPAGLPPILGDHSKIKQILINLLSNALKFTPGGGQVTVAAEYESDGAVAISVRDTGVGMAADEIPRALEPFTQVGGSAEIQQQGTGLGLPLAKAFTLLHGGALTIESAPGRGTCVTFRLPRERVLWEAAA